MTITARHCTKLAAIAMVLAYFVILFGAATRVWDAGMSCPDWPTCYGVLIPFPEQHVLAHTPEGYMVNGVHYVGGQVFLEWFHRLLASIVGLITLMLLFCAYKAKVKRGFTLVLAACLTLAIQIKLGGLTVFMNNIHWSVALHLTGAMLFFGWLIAARWRFAQAAKNIPFNRIPLAPKHVRLMFYGFSGLVLTTMVMGAMISSAFAGGVCGGLIDCQGQWWPDDILQKWHMTHRGLALLVFIMSTLLIIKAKKTAPELRHSARGLHVLMWGQVLLGIATLYSFSHYAEFYRYLSLTHLAWGSLLWMASIGVVCRFMLGDGGQAHGYKGKNSTQ